MPKEVTHDKTKNTNAKPANCSDRLLLALAAAADALREACAGDTSGAAEARVQVDQAVPLVLGTYLEGRADAQGATECDFARVIGLPDGGYVLLTYERCQSNEGNEPQAAIRLRTAFGETVADMYVPESSVAAQKATLKDFFQSFSQGAAEFFRETARKQISGRAQVPA
jgi:hypothetical protein